MRQAEKIFENQIINVMDFGVDSEQSRPIYADGSTANSRYITDVFEKYDLANGEVPITEKRNIFIKGGLGEIATFYQDQSSSEEAFIKNGVNWWSPWILEDGTIGERYGKTVHNYRIIDRLLEGLAENPWNRRNILNLWQYTDLDIPAKLPPCAFQVIFDVRKIEDEMYLDASLTQRSSDFLVAGHINMMQYVALQWMVAKHFGWKVGTFSRHTMNLHIYDNQFEQAAELLNRKPQRKLMDDPIKFYLDVPDKTNFYDIKMDNFILENYFPIKPQIGFPDLAI